MDVMIILGSDSDLETGKEATKVLETLGLDHSIHIASAHRTPDKVRGLVRQAEDSGAKAIIAGAGMSAHLAGVIASETLLPVIGIPMDGGALKGMDALLSTVNMPGGIPVATVSLGKAGGKNSALLAARIVALNNPDAKKKLEDYRKQMADKVEEADVKLQK